MANQVEIEITTVYNPGQGLGTAQQRIVADAEQIGRRVEQALEQSAQRASSAFADMSSKVNRELGQIRAEDVEIKVTVDDSDIRRAEGDIRDLDSIPAPQIDVEINSDEAVGGLMDAFDGIDMGSAVSNISGQLSGAFAAAGPVGMAVGAALAGAAALWGDDLTEGFTRGWNSGADQIKEQIRFGLSDIDLADVGVAAGDTFAAGIGESMESIRSTAALIQVEFAALDKSLDLSSATKQAEAFQQIFGVEVPESLSLVQRMVAGDLVPTVEAGFDLLTDTAQRFPLHFQEMMEVLNEFSPVFAKLGVDGAQAMDIIGATVREGLLPNVDRAAELFEEFNIEMQDVGGRAKPVIDELGLSWGRLNAMVADGRGAEAMTEIVAAIQQVPDEAKRAELAFNLFGASIESAADPDRVLALLATADATREVGGAADDMTAKVEEMSFTWEKAGRAVADFGAAMGAEASARISIFIEDLSTLAGSFQDFVSWVDEGINGTERWGNVVAAAISTVEGLPPVMNDIDAAAAAMNIGLEGSASGLDEVESAADDTASALDNMTEALTNSEDALNRWAGQGIDGAKAMIEASEAVEALDAETLKLIATQIDANGQFNLMTVEGARAQEALGSVRQSVADLTQSHREGAVSGQVYEEQMRNLERAFTANALAAGLSTEQIATMRTAIFDLPAYTDVEIELIENVTDGVFRVGAALAAVNGARAVTYIDTVRTTINRSVDAAPKSFGRAAGGFAAYAEGGSVHAAAGGGLGVPIIVNDGAGPEIARLPEGDLVELPNGSTVFTAEDSARMRGTAGGSGPTVHVEVHGSILTEQDLIRTVRDALFRGGFDGMGGVN